MTKYMTLLNLPTKFTPAPSKLNFINVQVGRHAAAVDFLRASGFLDADDADAEAEEERKGGLSGQPSVAIVLPWPLMAKKMALYGRLKCKF